MTKITVTTVKRSAIGLAACALVAGCATVAVDADYRQAALAMMKADFKSKGPISAERVLRQDDVELFCSDPGHTIAPEVAARLEAAQLATVVYPADGQYLGDWKAGEAIAQEGRGLQSSDAVGAVNGANCYACHQLTKEEISFGNLGPSLYNYGKLRGQSAVITRYTWGKIYNAQGYRACTSMPRFGHNGILTPAQIKDVMALLLDPASPVNK
ncbi:MAG: sulfur oxidation c-type cytochrome SoxX [Herminiimonas sp.]|nr:sulfur oxidation c-type cytochrome SoxX [Herminiimonas sp.]